MKAFITALEINVEQQFFNDDDKLTSRPRVAPIVVLEAEIPDFLLEWVREQLAKRGA